MDDLVTGTTPGCWVPAVQFVELRKENEALRAELARVRKLGEAMAEDAAVRISQADMERATKAVKSAGIERARIAPPPPRHLYAIAPGEPIRKPARKGRG